MKTKITCIQLQTVNSEILYEIVKLTNRTTPAIGTTINEKQLKSLLTESRGKLTIDITGKQ